MRRAPIRVAVALMVAVATGLFTVGNVGAAAPSKASGTTVVLGHWGVETNPATGVNTTLSRDIIDSFVKFYNAKDGAGGHKLSVIFKDDQNDPAKAKAAVQELLQAKVVAFAGQSDSASVPALAPDIQAAGVPLIGGLAYSTAYYSTPMLFAVGGTQQGAIYGTLKIAKDGGADSMGLVICNTSAICTASIQIFKIYAGRIGIQMPDSAIKGAGTTQPNYTAECLAMKDAKVESLLTPGINYEVIVKDCERQQLKVTWLDIENAIPTQVARSQASALAGARGALSQFPVFEQHPESKDFFTAMKKYHPEYFKDAGKMDQLHSGAASGAAWSAMAAVKKAIENAKVPSNQQVTTADVLRGLQMFKEEDLGGLSFPMTFVAGATANPSSPCWYVTGVDKKGNKFAPQGLEYECTTPDQVKLG
jgi:ABC-type branched-subunit amino acid transport system substrate-binding protein